MSSRNLVVCLALVLVFVFAYVPAMAKADTIEVPSECSTIQSAINAATSGDTVVVADGTYTGASNRDLDFGGKDITVKSENGPSSCIIDCEDTSRAFYIHSGETSDAVIEGFTIKNGYCAVNEYGGGIYICNASSPTVKNCVIKDCSSGWGTVTIKDQNSNPKFYNCSITSNSSKDGGGVYLFQVNCSAEFVNCLIADNTATEQGGGIKTYYANLTLINCTVANNTANNSVGGGIRHLFGTIHTYKNCIIWGNHTDYTGETEKAHQISIHANTPPTVLLNNCDYSNGTDDIFGTITPTDCITTNPKLVSSSDYHLQQDSPCIDTGKNSYVPSGVTTDLDGNSRIVNVIVDMGSYEYQDLADLVISDERTISDDMSYEDVTINSGGDLILDGIEELRTFRVETLTINNGGKVTIKKKAAVIGKKVTVNTGGEIDGEGLASWDGEEPGELGTTNIGGGGGGHAGSGGSGENASGGNGHGGTAYGDLEDPFTTGSSGGDVPGAAGGKGGAYIRLVVYGTLNVNGTIDANGTDGEEGEQSSSGGGAGGSVLIRAGRLEGNGTITACGGDSPNPVIQGGGGAGGILILILARLLSFSGSIINDGGTGHEDGGEISELSDTNLSEVGEAIVCLYQGYSYSIETDIFGAIGAIVELNQSYSFIHLSNSGGFSDTQGAVDMKASSPDVSVSIYYSSNDWTDGPHPLGKGWTHSFNQYLIKNSGDTQGERETVSWHRMCGKRVKYWDIKYDSTEKYTCIPIYGMANSTVEPTTGGYIATTKYETYYFKDFIDIGVDQIALLDKIVDKNGNELTCEYNGSNRLDYVKDSASREVHFHYDGSDMVDTIWAEYGGTTIPDTPKYISYDGDDHLYRAGTGTGANDWYWEYTYQAGTDYVTKKELFNTGQSRSTISYAYKSITDSRVVATTATVDGQPSVVTFEYDDSVGKVEMTGRSYDGTHNQSWTRYVDSVVMKYVETHETCSDEAISKENEFDTFGNATVTINELGGKTVNTYDRLTNDLLTSETTYNGELLTYSEYDYDSYHNMIKSWGPCKDKNKTTGKLAKTLVEYKYAVDSDDPDEYASRHLVREVVRKLSASDTFRTRYTYDTVNNYRLTKVEENYDKSSVRATEYTYYGSSDPDGPEGFLKETKIDPTGLNIVTTNKYFADGKLKETIDPMGVKTQYIYDDMGRLLASCSDVDGLQEGHKNLYNDAGLLEWTQRGMFDGNDWNQSSKTCTIDTSVAYSQTWNKYESGTGRLLATKGRLDFGTVYEYYENGAQKKVMNGEVDNWSTTPSIDTSKAYSEVPYTYYENGWLKDTVTLLNSSGGGTSSTVTNTYYDDGGLKEVTGPKYDSSNDMKVKYYYDKLGRTTSVERLVDVDTWAASQTSYDDYGRVATTTTPEIEQTSYSYNDYTGQLVTVTPPAGPKTHYEYNDFGQTIIVTQAYDSSGDELYSYTKYDAVGRVSKTCVSNTYDQDGLDDVWSSAVNRVEYSYNKNSAVWKTTTYDISDGISSIDSENIYDKLGRLEATSTDPDGLAEGTVYQLDALGRATTVQRVTFTSFEGDPTQAPGYTINQTLLTALSEYDDAGRLTKSIFNPGGSGDYADLTTKYEYDELSRQIKVYDPEGYAASTQYYTQYDYDNAGRLIKVTNTEDVPTFYTYFDSSRESLEYFQTTPHTQGSGIDVTYTYYPSGLLKTATYPGFDISYPETGSVDNITTYYYDLNGRLTKKVDGRGASGTIQYTYDGVGRLRYVDRDGDSSYEVEYTYNDRSQIEYMKESSSNKIYNQYDAYGRLSSVTDYTAISTGKTVSYAYYGSGLRKSMTDPESNTCYYHYDKAMRLVQINSSTTKDSGTIYVEYQYNDLGQLSKKSYGASAAKGETNYSYFANVGWLTEVENKVGTDVISRFVYHDSTNWTDSDDLFDKVGNRNCMYYKIQKDNATPPTFSEGYVHYRYDKLYQLTTERRTSDYTTTELYKNEFVYDDAGNRTSKEVDDTDTTSYTCNDANQLVTEDAPGTKDDWHYEFDAAGNMIYKKDKLPNPTKTYEWQYNSENRMTSYDPPGGANTSTYTYNLFGNRVQRDTKDLNEKYIFDGADVIADYDGDDSDTLLRSYLTPGFDDNAILWVPDGQGGEDDYYYFKDGLGSVRNITDTSGNLKNYYHYYAFGSPYDEQSSPPVTNRYTYTGREWDSESGAYYCRFRQLMSTQGRFTARDSHRMGNINPDTMTDWPIGFKAQHVRLQFKLNRKLPLKENTRAQRNGPNLYSYASANPVLFTDRTGCQPVLQIKLKKGATWETDNPVKPPAYVKDTRESGLSDTDSGMPPQYLNCGAWTYSVEFRLIAPRSAEKYSFVQSDALLIAMRFSGDDNWYHTLTRKPDDPPPIYQKMSTVNKCVKYSADAPGQPKIAPKIKGELDSLAHVQDVTGWWNFKTWVKDPDGKLHDKKSWYVFLEVVNGKLDTTKSMAEFGHSWGPIPEDR